MWNYSDAPVRFAVLDMNFYLIFEGMSKQRRNRKS